jgi:hypothetical protein
LDDDGDNELSVKETLDFLRRVAPKKQRKSITIQMAREFVDMLNVDGNGKISKE